MSSFEQLIEMKRQGEEVDWSDANKGHEFVRQLATLIRDWKGELPDLRDVFQPREMNQLLIHVVGELFGNKSDVSTIVTIVARTGYKVEADLDKNNRPLPNRCTPLHLMSALYRLGLVDKGSEIIRALFEIYDDFAVNYIGPMGRTHLHVACELGLVDVVRKFLDSRQKDIINCRDQYKNTPLLVALQARHDLSKEVVRLLLERGANVALANRRRETPLLVLCRDLNNDEENYDLIESLLFEINKKDKRRRQGMMRRVVNARDELGHTALFWALQRHHAATLRLLLRHGADPTIPDKSRVSPLHWIFLRRSDDNDQLDTRRRMLLLDAIEELPERQQRRQTSRIDAQWKGKTALHLALERVSEEGVRWLLCRGASPNIADREGQTAFHYICQLRCGMSNHRHERVHVAAWVHTFFAIVDEMWPRRSLLRLDVRDELPSGEAALHRALERENRSAFEALLRMGADPNLANLRRGETALHVIARRSLHPRYAQSLFEICDLRGRAPRIRIDVRDEGGDTPLHLALRDMSMNVGVRETVVLLLRKGASLSLVDGRGSPPLHLICMLGNEEIGLLDTFFKLCDEREHQVRIDAEDSAGRTPLQWAVANMRLRTIERLLERGADLSSLVFPTESYFGDGHLLWMSHLYKFAIAARALDLVDFLEKRGYEFVRSEALTIMKFFDRHRILDRRPRREELDINHWLNEPEFADRAKEVTIVQPSLTLHDLLRLPIEEASNRFTHRDYYEFWTTYRFRFLPWASQGVCARRLCEIFCRGFFWDWALDALVEVTHYRLPANCCEMIMDNLTNKDLMNICAAACERNDTDPIIPSS
ncbi:serine/threonine-protein phosphatase 6 regulatory ankyrin repeat subunit C-like [Trichogramma pretiosum]|uniref:serine/threonine-protein phosphatase 6 regulatory ankyrin repeat subunit C-like n=1 Tax=Trichogramma pretiosum TaxID=7493 RepID=UPI0006C9C493|nr:serine/threonine-protein phosphatase 6 regulatory ankyrin repeat subunit C-like [Trichogramma pretiosum]